MIVVVLTFGATLLRSLFNPTLGLRSPLLFHTLAVAIAAQVAGMIPGLAVTACSAVLIDYYFLAPSHGFVIDSSGDVWALLLFIAVGIALSIFGGARKRADDELRRIRYNLETAQHIANVGSWESEVAGKLWWSEQTYRIFGVPDGTPMQTDDFYAMVHPDDLDRVLAAAHRAAQNGADYDIEHRIVRRSDGQVRYVHQQAKFIDGGTRFIGSIKDLTERKQGEIAQEILSGLFKVCAACRRIKDGAGDSDWYSMETYMRLHGGARFSHGMCPDCSKQWSDEVRSAPKEPREKVTQT